MQDFQVYVLAYARHQSHTAAVGREAQTFYSPSTDAAPFSSMTSNVTPSWPSRSIKVELTNIDPGVCTPPLRRRVVQGLEEGIALQLNADIISIQ